MSSRLKKVQRTWRQRWNCLRRSPRYVCHSGYAPQLWSSVGHRQHQCWPLGCKTEGTQGWCFLGFHHCMFYVIIECISQSITIPCLFSLRKPNIYKISAKFILEMSSMYYMYFFSYILFYNRKNIFLEIN